MEIMFMLIGFSLLVALTFLGLYIWAVRNGQYEDSVTPAIRMLFDDGVIGGADESGDDDKDTTNKGEFSNGA
jgi:cbb3-type cytochrome oxidase maturation protein